VKSLVTLVGTKYRSKEMLDMLASLPNGEQLTLVREPGNQYDTNAIQVWARGHHIGYIPSSQNKPLAAAMDAAALAMPGGAARPAYAKPAKLAIDGGQRPMIEIEE
jgi:hypothetical protein